MFPGIAKSNPTGNSILDAGNLLALVWKVFDTKSAKTFDILHSTGRERLIRTRLIRSST